jgi:glycosyltransferase involved in cell wall biosynthesis
MVKVSVCMITYNHEPFIAQAIESVLMQRTSFPYELVIGEDCSTDGTREIVRQYAEKHPDIIRPLFREQNLGMHRNFVDTLAHCRGEYVALLEGDDYWTDPYKLQKQAEFLDEHPEYVLVCGNALTIREDEGYRNLSVAQNLPLAFDFDTRYLMTEFPVTTLTVMFRNRLLIDFPDLFYRSVSGDRWLVVLLSQHGKCHYLNDVLGVYRIHAGGIYQSRHQTLEERIAYLEDQIRDAQMWNEYFQGEYSSEVKTFCFGRAKSIVRFALTHGQIYRAMAYARLIEIDSLRAKRSRLVVRALRALANVFL